MSTSQNGSAGMKDTKHAGLHVIIVGGSIAGLTLAHSLHHSGISFIVLEAAADISPQAGASIVLMPSGCRIIDQLGMYEDISALTEPVLRTRNFTDDGNLVLESVGPVLIERRHGYSNCFLTRRDLLKVLHDHVLDKSMVKTSKRVSKIEHSESGVVAYCEDGSEYHGDIIVGADGVHSTVRRFMQEYIEEVHPGKAKKDMTAISAEYNCIFGLGDPVVKPLDVGIQPRTFSKGYSTLSFVGRGGKLYWFFFYEARQEVFRSRHTEV
jgi:2-polyprenyl-6-methoxyphenol hydroxylase-like FAD-dependent oxidoreductase